MSDQQFALILREIGAIRSQFKSGLVPDALDGRADDPRRGGQPMGAVFRIESDPAAAGDEAVPRPRTPLVLTVETVTRRVTATGRR